MTCNCCNSCGCASTDAACKAEAVLTCQKDEAYPQVANVCPDAEAVRLLKLDYASAASEMTAASGYMYQHAILLSACPEIADTLECIAIVEMKHATLLAAAIEALGGDPQYAVQDTMNSTTEWDGTMVHYAKYVKDILTRDIADEKAAIAQYLDHAAVIPTACVQNLLKRIAQDEELHVEILTGLLNEVT